MTKQANDSQLDLLQDLLLGGEKEKIKRLDETLSHPSLHAQAVSEVLPHAIKLSLNESKQLSKEIMPAVEDAVKVSVKRDIHVFADALFPVIGPAIRKSIGETLRQMVQSINQALEHSFSWQGIKWRWQAWRTGKSFAEIVLSHSLVFRVEQVFLIHKETGILIQHAALPEIEAQDGDLVSAMLTAIQDFVKDSFNVQGETGLNQLLVGDFAIWIEQGPDAVIAGVIRGNAPEKTREVLTSTLEYAHQQFAEDLADFSGDPTPFYPLEEKLKDCLLSKYQAQEKKVSWLTWLLIGGAFIAIMAWIGWQYKQHLDWQNYIEQLKLEPGIVVLEDSQSDRLIRGLRDPDAKALSDMLAQSALNDTQVEQIFEPYLALTPEFVIKRAKRVIAPPAGVNLDFDGKRLSLKGSTDDTTWLRQLEKRQFNLAGIAEIDYSLLNPKVDLSVFNPPNSVQLSYENEQLVARGQALYEWREQVREQIAQIDNIKALNDSQLTLTIDVSPLDLPTGVSWEYKDEQLSLSGHASNDWIQCVGEKIKQLKGVAKSDLRGLINSDLELFNLVKGELEQEVILFDSAQRQTDIARLNKLLPRVQLLFEQAKILSRPIKLIISGHSDSTGSYQRRVTISYERAQFVYQFLVNNGVSASLLELHTLVPRNQAKESSEKEKHHNRRVSFSVRRLTKSESPRG